MKLVFYPFTRLSNVRDANFHNVVIQAIVFGIGLYTLILAVEHSGGAFLISLKTIIELVLFLAIIATFIVLLLPERVQISARRPIALTSFAVALLSLVLSTALIFSRAEKGVLWWLELVIGVVSVFWLWRTADQTIGK